MISIRRRARRRPDVQANACSPFVTGDGGGVGATLDDAFATYWAELARTGTTPLVAIVAGPRIHIGPTDDETLVELRVPTAA